MKNAIGIVLLLVLMFPTALIANGSKEKGVTEEKKMVISMAPYRKAPTEEDGKIVLHFEELYNVDFDIWNIESSRYTELMGIRFASGEIPDVIDIRPDSLYTWHKQGVLAEIPVDLLKEKAPFSYEASLKEEPNFLKPGMIDGKLYSLQEVPPTDIRYPACVWRGDWLEAVGINDIPETLDEMEDAVYKFAKNDPDGNGKNDTYGISKQGMLSVYGAFGLDPDRWFQDGMGGLVMGIVHPDMKKALEILARWYADGVLDPEFITGENYGGYWALSHSFINGRIGYTNQGGYTHWYPTMDGMPKGGANYEEIKKLNPAAADNLKYGVPPVGPDGKYGIFFAGESNRIVANVITSFGVQLESDLEKFGQVLYVLDQIKSSSWDSYITSVNGFEGVDWEFDENKVVKKIGQAAQDENYIEAQGGAWNFRFFGNPDYSKRVNPILTDWAMDHNYGKGIAKHELMGKLPSGELYSSELSKKANEMIISVVTGDKPLSYYDTFVKEWYNAGGKVLTEEATAWYKDFWK